MPKFIPRCVELKNITRARRLFDEIPEPNAVIYNSMLKAYVQNEQCREAISLFSEMISLDLKPNCYIFPMVLKSCGKASAVQEGRQVHCCVFKNGNYSNPFIGTTLVDIYSRWGECNQAYKVFCEMPLKNVIAWTTMINGYILCNNMDSARKLFELAPERDVVLWNTMVSRYIESGNMVSARKLFDRMPNKDVMSWNTMLSGYANSGDIQASEDLFETMPLRNVFSWNGLIVGYTRQGLFCKVLSVFKRMVVDSDVPPNDATLVTVLSACAKLGALDLGKWIHVYADNNGYKNNIYVQNSLIDMYSKSGQIENAVDVFKGIVRKDLISWNTIIGALAVHGCGVDALTLFAQMKSTGIKPDGITFVGVLCACTHLGLVENGVAYFQSMTEYSIKPQIEHYGCLVDLYGRAGLLHQAMDFVKKMPVKADSVIWASLLGACRIHKNIELAELALEKLIELEPGNPAHYLMLSNVYGDAGKWEKASNLKVAMRNTGFRKGRGCSWIEVNDNRLVEFYSLDERHPEKADIYRSLSSLYEQLSKLGYEHDLMGLDMEA